MLGDYFERHPDKLLDEYALRQLEHPLPAGEGGRRLRVLNRLPLLAEKGEPTEPWEALAAYVPRGEKEFHDSVSMAEMTALAQRRMLPFGTQLSAYPRAADEAVSWFGLETGDEGIDADTALAALKLADSLRLLQNSGLVVVTFINPGFDQTQL